MVKAKKLQHVPSQASNDISLSAYPLPSGHQMDIIIEPLQNTQTSSKFQKEILHTVSSRTGGLPELTTVGLLTQREPSPFRDTLEPQPKKKVPKSSQISFYEDSDPKSGFSNSVVRKNVKMLAGKPTTSGNLIKIPDFNFDAPSASREPKSSTARKVTRSPKPKSSIFFPGNHSPPKAAGNLPLEVQNCTKNVADIETIKAQINMNTKNFDFDRIQEHNTSRKATHLLMVKVPTALGEESAAGIRVPPGGPSGLSPSRQHLRTQQNATEKSKPRFRGDLEQI